MSRISERDVPQAPRNPAAEEGGGQAPRRAERLRPRQARRIAVPADLRAFSPLDRIDYADAYRVAPTTGGHSAEAWLRTTFDDAPTAVMWAARAAWMVMGAELAPDPSPGHLFGCPLDVDGPDSARMAVTWGIGLRATIVAHAGENETVVVTFVQLDTTAARRAWWAVSPIHRSLMSVGLSLAARRLTRIDPPGWAA